MSRTIFRITLLYLPIELFKTARSCNKQMQNKKNKNIYMDTLASIDNDIPPNIHET